MPTLNIGGQILEFPEGTTPEQLQAYADQVMKAQGQQATMDTGKQAMSESMPHSKFLVGAGAAMAEPVIGINQALWKGLGHIPGAKNYADSQVAGLEDRLATIRGMREGAGGYGTAGEVSTWLAGGGAKAPQAIAQASTKLMPALARAATLGATEQAAYEGSKGTLEGDPTRLQRFNQGAQYGPAGGAAGEAIPRAASRLVEPFKASPAAQWLANRARQLGQQLNLSAGQAAGKGSTLGRIEEGLGGNVFVGPQIAKSRGEAIGQWNQMQLADVVRTADPKRANYVMRDTGADAIALAQDAVKTAYRDALAGRTLRLAPNDFNASLNSITRLAPSDAAVAEKVLQNVTSDIHSGNITGDAVTKLRSEVAEVASKQFRDGNYPLGRAITQIDNELATIIERSGTAQNNARLKAANAAYSKLADINLAGAMQGAVTQGGTFTPSQLVNAIRRGEPASQIASQRTPGLREAVEANEVLGNTLPSGPGTAEKLMANVIAGGAAGGAVGLATGDWDEKTALAMLAPALAGRALSSQAAARYLVPGVQAGSRRPAVAKFLFNTPRGPVRQAATRSITQLLKDEEE